MIVTLSAQEVGTAAMVGIRRAYMSRNAPDTVHSGKGKNWDMEVIGALGECAVAKATKRYWSPDVGLYGKADVDGGLCVRTTDIRSGNLIVREKDSGEIYVLATGRCDVFNVVGWISAEEAKTDKFWRTDKGEPFSWWVPQSALHPIEELVAA
jgi:hypothetical protein